MNFLRSTVGAIARTVYVLISAINRMLQRKNAGLVFRSISAMMFVVLSIVLFPAASENLMSADDDYPVGGAEAVAQRTRVQVIYRDNAGSEWARTAALRLSEELFDRYGYEAELIPASKVSVGSRINNEGAIVIGHTDLSECDYVESYYNIGADGCNTYFNSMGDLIIEAFGSVGADAGIDIFLSGYNADAVNAVLYKKGVSVPDLDAVLTNVANGISYSNSEVPSITVGATRIECEGDLKTVIFAAPDNDRYSLRAMKLILDEETPDMVVFCGELSAGAEDRMTLSKAWDDITALLAERDIAWSFIPADEDSALPATMINEVLLSKSGCMAVSADRSATIVATRDGVPFGALWLISKEASGDALCAELKESAATLALAADGTVPGAIISGAVTCEAAALLEESEDVELRAGHDAEIAGLYETAAECGVECFAAADDPLNVGVTEKDGISVALAGSIGYESEGPGGRFEYNHSLRGALVLTLSCDENGRSGFDIRYLYASELGADQR